MLRGFCVVQLSRSSTQACIGAHIARLHLRTQVPVALTCVVSLWLVKQAVYHPTLVPLGFGRHKRTRREGAAVRGHQPGRQLGGRLTHKLAAGGAARTAGAPPCGWPSLCCVPNATARNREAVPTRRADRGAVRRTAAGRHAVEPVRRASGGRRGGAPWAWGRSAAAVAGCLLGTRRCMACRRPPSCAQAPHVHVMPARPCIVNSPWGPAGR